MKRLRRRLARAIYPGPLAACSHEARIEVPGVGARTVEFFPKREAFDGGWTFEGTAEFYVPDPIVLNSWDVLALDGRRIGEVRGSGRIVPGGQILVLETTVEFEGDKGT